MVEEAGENDNNNKKNRPSKEIALIYHQISAGYDNKISKKWIAIIAEMSHFG